MPRLSALLALLLLWAAPARAEPPVWVVRDADSTIVLFGSVHLLPPGLDWQTPALRSAVAEADDLWFEIGGDAATQLDLSQRATAAGLLPEGERLSQMLSQEARQRLERIASGLGLSMGQLDRYRPWLAESQIFVAYAERRGASSAHGVERKVDALAPRRVERRALESPAVQIATLADGSVAEQIAAFEESLRQIEQDPSAFDRLVSAWMAGDGRAMLAEAEPLRRVAPRLYARLLGERNRRWVEPIIERLEGKGRTVIVVGAAHLAGPEGLPALLRARGVVVEGPR